MIIPAEVLANLGALAIGTAVAGGLAVRQARSSIPLIRLSDRYIAILKMDYPDKYREVQAETKEPFVAVGWIATQYPDIHKEIMRRVDAKGRFEMVEIPDSDIERSRLGGHRDVRYRVARRTNKHKHGDISGLGSTR